MEKRHRVTVNLFVPVNVDFTVSPTGNEDAPIKIHSARVSMIQQDLTNTIHGHMTDEDFEILEEAALEAFRKDS